MTLNALKVEENLITIHICTSGQCLSQTWNTTEPWAESLHVQWSVALLSTDEHKLEEWEEGGRQGLPLGGRESSNSIGAILLFYKTRNISQSSYVSDCQQQKEVPESKNLILRLINLINSSF